MRLFLFIALLSLKALNMSTPTIQTPAPTPAQSAQLNALDSRETSLIRERTDSENWEHRWHSGYTICLIVAALFGGLSILFQTWETSRAQAAKKNADDIAEIGRERHEIEKQISDLAIAEANAVGAEATAHANDAQERAKKLEQANIKLNTELEKARGETKKVQSDLEIQRGEVARVTAEAENAKKSAEDERIARLKLEEDISPRIVEQGNSSEELKQFHGMKYALKVVADADLETRRTVGQIRELLNMANWTEDKDLLSLAQAQQTDDGITIEFNPRIAAVEGNISPDAVTDVQAGTLKDILRRNKIQCWSYPRGLSNTKPGLPALSIIIHVGLKPLGTYFTDKRLNELPAGPGGNRIGGNALNPPAEDK